MSQCKIIVGGAVSNSKAVEETVDLVDDWGYTEAECEELLTL